MLRILQNEQEHEIKAVEVTSLQDISHTFSLQYGAHLLRFLSMK